MKKLILPIVVALLVAIGFIAQGTTIQINGTITSSNTSLPVANQLVYIMSDSSAPGFNYYNIVYTNSNGVYSDVITVPANTVILFTIGTYDCNQQWNGGAIACSPNQLNYTYNFNICTSTTTQCQANFYAVPDSTSPPTGPFGVYFGDNSIGNPISWSWSFGDGTSSSIPYTYHQYATVGSYMVCLTIVTANGCTSTFCDSLFVGNITPPCSNSFQANVSPNGLATFVVTPNPFIFYSSYFWTFGDGGTSTLASPTHTYTQSGYYSITLTTIDNTGCTAVSTQTLYVSIASSNCQAMFQAINDSVNPLSFYFANLSTGSNLSYQWNFGDNTVSSSQYGAHTYLQGGSYMVCLTIWNNSGCQSTYCDTIYAGGGVPCSNYFYYGSQLLYTSFYGYAFGGTPPYTYLWSFGDGTSSTLMNPSHTYAASGSYVVTLTTADANGCTFTSTQMVSVSSSNPMTIWGQVTANSLPVDFGSLYLYGISPSGNSWYLMDTTSIDSAGYYWFGNVYQGVYAIVAELTANSSLYGQYMPTYYGNTIFWSGASLITLGQPINPYNIELQAGIPPFFGPGNIGGTITTGAKLYGKGAPLPNIEILLLDMTNTPLMLDYSDASGNFNFNNLPLGTYKVYAEVGGIPTNPAVITLNNSNPNANTVSLVMTASGISTGIENHETISVNKLYPNPASDVLSLELNTIKSGNISINVADVLGNVVLTQSAVLTSGNNKLNVNISEITPGSYTLQCVLSDGSRIVRKIAVVR